MLLRKSVNKRRGRKASPFFSLKNHYTTIFIFLLLLCSLCYGHIPLASAQNPMCGFNPAKLPQSGDGAFLETNSFAADNALPLQAIFSDQWDGPFSPKTTNRLDTFWKIDSGLVYRGWKFSGFYRGELYLNTNKDTLQILRTINLKQNLAIGKEFVIDLQTTGFSASGFEIAKGIRLDNIINGLSIGFTARYLRGEKIQEGTIKGKLTPTGQKSYDFALLIDYIYDKNLLYTRRDTIPGSGHGYSFDFGLLYAFGQKWKAEVLLKDIGGRISWKDIPYTTAEAISNVKEYDEEGYQIYRPSISGYESYKNFTQKIPLKTDIIFSYRKGPFTFSPLVNFIQSRALYWINLHYTATKDLSFHTGYNINYGAFSLGASYKKTLLDIWASSINLNRAAALGLKLSARYEW